MVQSLRAIDAADVVLLVLDACEGITDQDSRLLNLAIDRGKAILVVVNKWDLLQDKSVNIQDFVSDLRLTFERQWFCSD